MPAPLPKELCVTRPRPVRASSGGIVLLRILVAWGLCTAAAFAYAAYGKTKVADLWWTGGVCLFLLLVILTLAMLAMSDGRMRRRLERTGEAVAGTITGSRWVGDGEGGRELQIFYHYLEPAPPDASQARLGSDTIAALGFEPHEGHTVFVLYDAQAPKKHLIWGYSPEK